MARSPHHVAVQHAAEKAVINSAHQHWHYDHKSGYITGFDGRVLDVEGSNKAQGTKLIAYDKNPGGTPNQQWEYKDGSFYSKLNGFVIDINGGKVADGSDLILWPHHGGPNQKWDVDHHGFVRTRANNNFCVDLNGGPKPAKGLGKVTLWTAAATLEQAQLVTKLQGAQHQRWHYDHKSGYITGFDGRVLDVEGGNVAQGTRLIFYPKNAGGTANQQWDYKDGSFFSRMGTGFVIDVEGGKIADGTSLILWAHHGGPNQKWDIDQFGVFRSRKDTKYVLDVSGGAFPSQGQGKVTLWSSLI